MSKRLGSVASELVKDEGIRSGIGTTFKVIGWTIAGTVLFFVGKKIVKGISHKIQINKAKKRIKEELDLNQSKISYEEAWYESAVVKLKRALATEKGYKTNSGDWLWTSIDEDAIIAVLTKLKNEFDWKQLILKFGTVDGHDLKEWIGLDDETDVKKYNLMLSNIGVKEIDLIENVPLKFSPFGGVGAMPTPIM